MDREPNRVKRQETVRKAVGLTPQRHVTVCQKCVWELTFCDLAN